MVDYIHPIRDLQGSLKRSHQALMILGALLAITIIAVPMILHSGPVVVVDEGTFSRTVKSRPWDLTFSRVEGFTRQYLASRWNWSAEDFPTKRANLADLLVPATFAKLKDSFSTLES